MSASISTFRNKTALLIEAVETETDDSREARLVEKKYKALKRDLTIDGWWRYLVGNLLAVGPFHKQAAEANGFYDPKKARKAHAALQTSVFRDYKILLRAMLDENLISKDAPDYHLLSNLIQEVSEAHFRTWNKKAAVQVIKEVYADARQEFSRALAAKKKMKDEIDDDNVPHVDVTKPAIFTAAYELGLFGKPELPRYERSSAQNYTSSGHENINNVLRKGDWSVVKDFWKEQVKEDIENLDSAIGKFKVVKPLKTMRAVSFETQEEKDRFVASLNGMVPGTRFKDAGFVSTSTNPSAAEAFFKNEHPHQFAIHVDIPAGSKVMPIGAATNSIADPVDNECEVLLPRNSVFEIVKVERDLDRIAERHIIVVKLVQGK